MVFYLVPVLGLLLLWLNHQHSTAKTLGFALHSISYHVSNCPDKLVYLTMHMFWRTYEASCLADVNVLSKEHARKVAEAPIIITWLPLRRLKNWQNIVIWWFGYTDVIRSMIFATIVAIRSCHTELHWCCLVSMCYSRSQTSLFATLQN